MDRKEFLSALTGRYTRISHRQPSLKHYSPASGLAPYSGSWNYELAAHLLRRTTFGPTNELINQSVAMGMNATITKLFEALPLPAAPRRYLNDNIFTYDPDCAIGEDWTIKPMSGEKAVAHRRYSLSAWNLMQLLKEGISIREKMTLFWMNHFGCGNLPDPRADYVYVQLLRAGALGSFKQLVKDVTITPSMLHFLNGDLNEKGAPNENFAREVLELFTIGKGPLIGPGDYTNYTELDIAEMAKCFSGWRIEGFWGANDLTYTKGVFYAIYHDSTTKKLSSKFGSAVIYDGGDKEYANVIDIIFKQNEVSNFICRKLYRWFCYYKIDASVETNVIQPMAQVLRDNNFNIQAALTVLLKSEHFYDTVSTIGPMIKSPIDYMLSALKQSRSVLPVDWRDQYSYCFFLYELLEVWQQSYFGIPSVAGWKAYYQDPLYYRMWINASSLQQHQDYVNKFVGNGYTYKGEGSGQTLPIKIKPLPILESFKNPLDPNSVVRELALLLLPVPLPAEQLDALKGILLPGLPDFEWTVEYNDYLNDPTNAMKISAVETRLKSLLSAMFMLAENHLS